jgi:ribonucleoside-diphosphate reductase alpha chain
VPLRDLVNKFAHVRFEPSGFTGNSEIPIAKSIVDYIFRWLGSRFLPADERASLGLIDRSQLVDSAPAPFGASALAPKPNEGISAVPEAVASPPPAASGTPAPSPQPEGGDESPGSTAAASSESVAPPAAVTDGFTVIAQNGHANGHSNGNGNGTEKPAATGLGAITLNFGGAKVAFAAQADAPSCAECGSIMVRNGSCYKCLNCGSTSGCS